MSVCGRGGREGESNHACGAKKKLANALAATEEGRKSLSNACGRRNGREESSGALKRSVHLISVKASFVLSQ
jgi:hypothetical protein